MLSITHEFLLRSIHVEPKLHFCGVAGLKKTENLDYRLQEFARIPVLSSWPLESLMNKHPAAERIECFFPVVRA